MDTMFPSPAGRTRCNGLIKSVKRISSSVRRNARLITCELLRTVQEVSSSQHPGVE
jgi:hypothetical protein